MDHKSDLVHNHHTDDDLYVCLHLSELVGAIKCGKLTSRTRIVTGVATAAIFIVLLFIIVAEYVFKMKKLRKQDPSEQTTLDWKKRFQTIEGIAQGILYLRKYSKLNVIHRGLKASNIPLDQDMIPKVSNIEMARIFGINQIEAKTNQVDGTYGYMSPEYALYGQFSEKSDVFNFGVLLLVANGTLFSIALDSPQPF